MRRIFRVVVVMLWMGFLSGTAWPGTFYVSTTGSDSNPGSQALPWKTLQKAAATLVAGDTAIVLNGTYTEPEVQMLKSGTAGNPITLKAQNQHLAILSSTSRCNPSISLYGSYVTIENMRIKRDATDLSCGTSPTSARAMIRAWPDFSGTNAIVRGVYIDPGGDLGLKIDQTNALVENSTIHNALEGFAALNVTFRGNLVDGSDVWGSTVTSKGGMRNFLFYNNIVHQPLPSNTSIGAVVLGGSSGCCMAVPADAYECLHCVAYNNVVINDSGDRNSTMITLRSCKNCTVMNNVTIGGATLIMMAGGSASVGIGLNPTWENNIFSCSGGPALHGTWLTNGTLTLDYNNFFNCTGVPTQTHAISGDPKLVNQTTDFHLQAGSPAIGTGLMLATRPAYGGGILDTSRDMSGVIRATPWSLGVYAANSSGNPPPASPRNLRVQ